MNYFFLLLFILFFQTVTFSQILTIDRENGQDSIQKKIKASTTFHFSIDKQKNTIIDCFNKTEVDYFTNNQQVLIFLAQSDFAFNGSNSLEKNGDLQLRYRDNDTRIIAPEYYIQYQWNGIFGMEHRTVEGINIRLNCLEKKASDLYVSIGAFYENEKWNPFSSSMNFTQSDLSIVNRSLFRLNSVAKFAFKITKGIDFSGVSYLQFPLNNHFMKPRWYFGSNLNFEVNKHLNFVVEYEHTLDYYRPLPIDHYYYSVSLGLVLKI